MSWTWLINAGRNRDDILRNHLSRLDYQSIKVKELPEEFICSVCGEIKPISLFPRYLFGDVESSERYCFNRVCWDCRRQHSSVYLGVTITEKVLCKVFPNVERMPMGNHGYDFICGKGFKVDSKAACRNINGYWSFGINRNKIADYFACIAFDNRTSLIPMYFWLIPGGAIIPYLKGRKEKKMAAVNEFTAISIAPSTLGKWKEYEKPIDKILTSCNMMKSTLSYFILMPPALSAADKDKKR